MASGSPPGAPGDSPQPAGYFSLLSLPDLVLDTLVEAIGRSSVQSLLNLRLVCKEAKEWVDGKPQAVREKFYCKGQVRLALDVASIRLFNMWMSQASVTSLSLDPSRIGYGDLPQRRRMWGKFLSYWMPHLENLEIQREPAQNFLEREVNYDAARELIRKLLQSPRLKKVVFLGPFDWQLATPFPRSFHNITDLVIDGSLSNFVDMYEHSNRSQSDEGVKDFYTQLAQNDNLKSVALKSSSLSHIRGIKRFFKELIKRDRRDLRVQITVTDIFRFCDNTVESFVGLVKKAIDSKCAVNYHIIADSDYDNLNWLFTTMKNSPQEDKLSPEEYMHFTQQQLESLIDEISRDDPSVLDVQSLQGLKNLGMTNVDPESLKDVIFPRSLVTLGCGEGFPSVSNLPLTLTKLCLYKVECGLEELESSMTAIGVHCINLRELLIAYVCNDKTVKNASSPTIDGCGNSEVAPFRALKSLTLKAYVSRGDEQVAIARELIVKRLKIQEMPLEHLCLSTHPTDAPLVQAYNRMEWWMADGQPAFRRTPDNPHNDHYLRLVDEYILQLLCEDVIGTSLQFVEIPSWTMTPKAARLMGKLKSKITANIRNRVEREGKGPWLHQYKQHFFTGPYSVGLAKI